MRRDAPQPPPLRATMPRDFDYADDAMLMNTPRLLPTDEFMLLMGMGIRAVELRLYHSKEKMMPYWPRFRWRGAGSQIQASCDGASFCLSCCSFAQSQFHYMWRWLIAGDEAATPRLHAALRLRLPLTRAAGRELAISHFSCRAAGGDFDALIIAGCHSPVGRRCYSARDDAMPCR